MQFIYSIAIVYFLFILPYKLWKTEGQLKYFKNETKKEIETLKFNNEYYIENINSLKQQNKFLEDKKNMYYSLWDESVAIINNLEDAINEIDDEQTKIVLFNIIEGEETDSDF